MITIETNLSEKKIEEHIALFMAGRGYRPFQKIGPTIIFEGGKDFGVLQFLFWCVFGLLPGIAYLFMCRNKQITVQIKGSRDKTAVYITAVTNHSGGDAFALESYVKKLVK